MTALDGPALCFSNHQANGETILRTGKVNKRAGDEHGMWNYSKLCYNTKYPWESAPAPDVEAQQYVLRDGTDGHIAKANVTFWAGERDGVLYRRQYFDYGPERECHWTQGINLADFAVPYGILRVDRLKIHRAPVFITLGAYGFPDNGTEIAEKACGGAKCIILKGKDAVGREKQLAMTVYGGWQKLDLLHSTGTNPDSERSVVVFTSMERRQHYGGFEPYVLISQVITKESAEDFAEEELFPVREVVYTDPEGTGSFGPVTLKMKDGSVKIVDFEQIEGRLML